MKARLNQIIESLEEFLKTNMVAIGYELGNESGKLKVFPEFPSDDQPENFTLPAITLAFATEAPTMREDMGNVTRSNLYGISINFFGRDKFERDVIASQMKVWFEDAKRIPIRDYEESGDPIVSRFEIKSVDSSPLRITDTPNLQKWRVVVDITGTDFVSSVT